jgi:DNA-binding NarL/FixJ family response regulator
MNCTGTRHGTGWARQRHGCTCPEAIAARRAQRGQPVRSRHRPGRVDPELTAERIAAVERLTRYGHTASQIAERLGIAQRTVVRYRAQLREQQAA